MSHISSHLPEMDSLADLLPAFEFDRLIGLCPSGALYKACHRSLEREVAIKILPCDTDHDPRFRQTFQATAKVMARLTHPSLIRVYDSGDLDGHLYTVMEYAHGTTLQECAHGVAVDPQQAVEIVSSACQGLTHAHENGVVHGDIRPANIFLNSKCEPKIGNFRLPGHSRQHTGRLITQAREYIAPEIVSQSQCGGPQADVFALGVILRELLTGIPAGSEHAAHRAPADPKLDAICRKATHPDPASRYLDTRALGEQLDQWIHERKSAVAMAKPQPTMHRQMPATRRATPAFPSPRTAIIKKRQSSGYRTLAKCGLFILPLLCAGFLTHDILQRGIQKKTQAHAAQVETSAATETVAIDPLAIYQELALAISGNNE
jgi:serine/threonine protein kinase